MNIGVSGPAVFDSDHDAGTIGNDYGICRSPAGGRSSGTKHVDIVSCDGCVSSEQEIVHSAERISLVM